MSVIVDKQKRITVRESFLLNKTDTRLDCRRPNIKIIMSKNAGPFSSKTLAWNLFKTSPLTAGKKNPLFAMIIFLRS
jgi:hypothetical protein